MKFKDKYPDFAAVEAHIRQARAERSVYLAGVIVEAVDAVVKGFRQVVEKVGANIAAESDRRAIEADAFLKRYVQ